MMTTTAQTRDSDCNVLDCVETSNLIASDKVEGTSVCDSKGEKLGTIRSVMIGKMDGKVHYVIMGFGGLLGMDEDNYPLPWDALDYDTKLDGYRMKTLSKDELDKEKAPRYGALNQRVLGSSPSASTSLLGFGLTQVCRISGCDD